MMEKETATKWLGAMPQVKGRVGLVATYAMPTGSLSLYEEKKKGTPSSQWIKCAKCASVFTENLNVIASVKNKSDASL